MATALDEKTSALVLRQVEFYFSDSNLPSDKFLRQCVEEAEDGLVSLPLVCSFGRMRSHLGLKESGPDKVPAETTAAVAEVLRKSTVLKLSDDGQKVGRVELLARLEEVQAAVDARSIAVGPLRWAVTMEEVEAVFTQHAKVNSVRLPRHPVGRAFCGSAVVELCSEDEANKALELKLSYDGVDLELKPKKDLDAELERSRLQAMEGSNGRRELSFTKGLIVRFSLQKTGAMEAGESEIKEVSAAEGKEGEPSKEVPMNSAAEGKEGEPPKEVPVNNASEEAAAKEGIQISREDIRNSFKGFGYIKYIDFNRGDSTGYIRYEKPEEVHKARTAAVLADAGGIVVKDYIATLEAVEGAAEEEYWINVRECQEKVRAESGRGSFGRGGGGSRGRSNDRHQRDKKLDRSGGKGGKREEAKVEIVKSLGKHQRFEDDQDDDEAEQEEAKAKIVTSLGKHQRFEESDDEGKVEHPVKQSKTEAEADAGLCAKQSSAGDTPT